MPVRYSTRPFPVYRHRPGSTPHPIRDPQGHSYIRPADVRPTCDSRSDEKEPSPATIDDGNWTECDGYLFAVDLFNHGYYWEAHEELESLWIAVGRNTAVGRFLQGIIQAAAALLKLEADNPESAGRLVAAAAAKLREPQSSLLGLDGAQLADDLERELTPARPRAVIIVLAATS